MLDERGLQRVQVPAVREPLDRRDLGALDGDGEQEAGVRATAVDEDRAGTALAVVAALLRACQAKVLAQGVEQDAFQCGYCTPGQICSAVGLLAEARAQGFQLTEDVIRERMSGNICRCGAYPNIVAAVKKVGDAG